MSDRPASRPWPLLPVLPVLLALSAVLLAPSAAQAREYEMTRTEIDAEARQDGSLLVTEVRTFDFDGSFNGVYWDIPQGYNSSNGKDVEVDIMLAGEGSPGDVSEFEESTSGQPGTYEVSDLGSDVRRVKLYAPHEDEAVQFTIVYEATGILTNWEDTAELYWKFVSDGWEEPSENVTCTLHLPVPSGETVNPGENVRAWGHGPLDASVEFSGDEIVYTVPGVGTDEFAEMRVTFPPAWMPGLEVSEGEALPGILAEEQQWADEANARRTRARAVYVGGIVGGVTLAAGTVVAALVTRSRYRRDFRPQFQDTYYRDVPTGDHPAVLGAFFNGGDAESKELTVALMRLADEGYVRLERVKRQRDGLFGKKDEEDFRLVKLRDVPSAEEVSGRVARDARDVDERTLSFLFDQVAADGGEGASELLFSQIDVYAKEHAQDYVDALDGWKGVVEGSCLERFLGDGRPVRGRGLLCALGIACFTAAALSFIMVLATEGSPILAFVLVALLVGAGAVAFVMRGSMVRLDKEAVEVKAKLEALQRWLREFTRLEEAVPTDVVLWRRLLVMAVALDVADEVVEQLRMALPKVLDDPLIMPTYAWIYWHTPGGPTPASELTDCLDSAHHVSVAALAASDLSSGSGGGGGFSGGGGGGFGGGGGGGAF